MSEKENTSTALAVRPHSALSALVFESQNPLQALEIVGGIAAKSGAFGFSTTQGGAVAIITCLETGMTLTEYNRTYDCVEGKNRKKALAALVEFEKSGGKFDWLMTGDEPAANPDDQKATLHLERGTKKLDYTYSMRDAKQEELVKPHSRWTKRPGNMLRARCITNGLGIIAPEIFAGEYDESDRVAAPLLSDRPERPEQPKPDVTVTVAPEQKKDQRPDNVIDIQATAATAAASAPQEQTSTTPPAAPPVDQKKFAVTDVQVDPQNTSKLSIETAMAIDALIPADLKAKAMDWLTVKTWLKPGQALEDLNIDRARRLVDKTEVFLNHVRNHTIGGAK